jgi:hypothetical protein
VDIQTVARNYASNPEYAKKVDERMHTFLSRSATDPGFRQQLLTDPRAAISQFTGVQVPESFNVKFIENKATATIVLPDPVNPAAELSEQELEAVAGGTTVLCTIASALWIIAESIELTKSL